MNFSQRDVRWLSDTVHAIYAAPTIGAMADAVSHLTHARFGGMVSGVEQIALDLSRYRVHAARMEIALPRDYEVCMHDHPLFAAFRRGERPRSFQVARVLSGRELGRTDYFNGFGRAIGLRDNLAIFAYGGHDLLSVSLLRDRRFAPAEHKLLQLLQPHWQAALAQLRLPERVPARSHVATISHHDRIAVIDHAGVVLLQAYFAGWRSRMRLPGQVADWASASLSTLGASLPNQPLQCLSVASDRGRLLIRLVPQSDGYALQFTEIPAPMAYAGSVQPPLTSRERDILRWMCEGKRNPEIAAIVGIATRTVDKHVEHLRAKFGVGSRGRIVAKARGG